MLLYAQRCLFRVAETDIWWDVLFSWVANGKGGKGKEWKHGRKKKEVIRSLKKCRADENARGLRFNRTHWEFQAGDVCLSAATEKCPW